MARIPLGFAADHFVEANEMVTNTPGCRYEIPPAVIREAIVNAVAHRDYTSAAAVQVSVFADRVEVWNPGELIPPLTPAGLRVPHSSIARNPRICEALFLARYIEKYGTGTLMMIRESRKVALPEPDFVQRGGEFVIALGRDWLTEQVIIELKLNERQQKAVLYLKVQGQITNSEYQKVTNAIKKTASRDLDDLVECGVLQKFGTTGRGTFYTLAVQGDIKGTKETLAAMGSQPVQQQKRPVNIAPDASLEDAGKTRQRSTKGDIKRTNKASSAKSSRAGKVPIVPSAASAKLPRLRGRKPLRRPARRKQKGRAK